MIKFTKPTTAKTFAAIKSTLEPVGLLKGVTALSFVYLFTEDYQGKPVCILQVVAKKGNTWQFLHHTGYYFCGEDTGEAEGHSGALEQFTWVADLGTWDDLGEGFTPGGPVKALTKS